MTADEAIERRKLIRAICLRCENAHENLGDVVMCDLVKDVFGRTCAVAYSRLMAHRQWPRGCPNADREVVDGSSEGGSSALS